MVLMFMNAIRNLIYEKASRISPGLLEALNLVCTTNTGRDCIDILFDEPKVLRRILLGFVGSAIAAKIVIKLLFLKPIERYLNADPEALANLFLEDIQMFKEFIRFHYIAPTTINLSTTTSSKAVEQ